MQERPDHKTLAHWLVKRLSGGIVVTSDVTDYAQATFGTSDLFELLAELLAEPLADPAANETDCETDSLLELIFYPDLAAQLSYEAHWGRKCFSSGQQSQVEAILCTGAMKLPLKLPEDGRNLWIQSPGFALSAYVQRLNITWRIQPPLHRAIEASRPGDAGLPARVSLRNARLEWHPRQVALVEHFLAQKAADADAVDALLPFLLSILPEMAPETDAFAFLMSKKFFYFQALCKAEDYEQRRNSSNMEIMMLQGSRSAFGSLDEWRRKMRRIDDIARHLFGRTHFFQQPDGACIDLQTGESGQNIKDVMRILS